MLITRFSPLGGRPIKEGRFPLHTDKQGNFGLLLGYLPDGDKILVPMTVADEFACQFAYTLSDFKNRMGEREPREPIRHKLVRLLGGTI